MLFGVFTLPGCSVVLLGCWSARDACTPSRHCLFAASVARHTAYFVGLVAAATPSDHFKSASCGLTLCTMHIYAAGVFKATYFFRCLKLKISRASFNGRCHETKYLRLNAKNKPPAMLFCRLLISTIAAFSCWRSCSVRSLTNARAGCGDVLPRLVPVLGTPSNGNHAGSVDPWIESLMNPPNRDEVDVVASMSYETDNEGDEDNAQGDATSKKDDEDDAKKPDISRTSVFSLFMRNNKSLTALNLNRCTVNVELLKYCLQQVELVDITLVQLRKVMFLPGTSNAKDARRKNPKKSKNKEEPGYATDDSDVELADNTVFSDNNEKKTLQFLRDDDWAGIIDAIRSKWMGEQETVTAKKNPK